MNLLIYGFIIHKAVEELPLQGLLTEHSYLVEQEEVRLLR